LLGDIVISMPHAVEQAKKYAHSLQREIGYLTCIPCCICSVMTTKKVVLNSCVCAKRKKRS
jgi:hypothetical protein